MRGSLLVILLTLLLAGKTDGWWRRGYIRHTGKTDGWWRRGYIRHTDLSGCFKDSARRVLGGGLTRSNNMSVKKCRARCQRENTRYFGLENGNECFCGNVMRHKIRKSIKDCKKKCTGSGEACGGGWRILVYKLSSSRRWKTFHRRKGVWGRGGRHFRRRTCLYRKV